MIGIVVLNFNGADDTIECLHSLLALEGRHHRIYLIDNASGSSDAERLRDHLGIAPGTVARSRLRRGDVDISVEFLPTNLGYAGGNNVGVERALADGCDAVWILNNDTVADRGALLALRRQLTVTPGSLVGSLIVDYHDREHLEAQGGFRMRRWTSQTIPVGAGRRLDLARRAPPQRVDVLHGAAILVPASVVEAVGALQDDHFLYYEEIDFTLRCRQHGVASIVCPDAVVFHKGGGSTGTSYDLREKSTLATYYASRNAVAVTRRHHARFLPTVVLARFGYALLASLRGQTRLVRPILRGVLDGLRDRMGRTWP